MRVLLVEDTDRLREVVAGVLRASGYRVEEVATCAAATAALEQTRFDLAIIDVGLPDGSGLALCRALRGDGHDLPVLVLTARNEIGDRVEGLDAGADDYMGKPFSNAELCARVRALGRRGPRLTEAKRVFGDITIDRDRRTVLRAGELVPLTARELDIVALLAWADGRVVSRDEILESVWGDVTPSASASLEVLLTRIRRKLGGNGAEIIRTVRQLGYAWALARSKQS